MPRKAVAKRRYLNLFSCPFHSTEIIADGIGAVRGALEEVSRHLPQDEYTQREYAQRFLEASREGGRAQPSERRGQGHM